MDWKEKYDKAQYGLIAYLVLILIGITISYYTFIYPSSFRTFYLILLYGKNDLQTQLMTMAMLPALFAFYFIQFRWQMNRASQAFVGLILFTAVFIMAAKFL